MKSAGSGRHTKNEQVTIPIRDLGQNGEGIGRIEDGYTLFVPNTVPGDVAEVRIVKAGKSYGFGRLCRLFTPSPDRSDPVCPAAGTCGGCQLQFLRYEAQLSWKEEKVRNDLIRIGGIGQPPMEPIVGMEQRLRYRNKAQFPVGTDRDGHVTAGFYAGHSHRIVPCRDCQLGVKENAPIMESVLQWMEKNHIPAYDESTGSGFIRHVLIRKGFASGEILVCLVTAETIPEKWKEALVRSLRDAATFFPADTTLVGITINLNPKKTNVILGEQTDCIWGRAFLYDRLESQKYGISVTYQISPQSFFQVNHEQTQKLYEKVLDLADLTGKETVLDLYCGIGTISLFLAKKAGRVIGVEIVPQAIRDARKNAEQNQISNVEFFTGKAEEVVPALCREREIQADVVVVDPPRKGCDTGLLETILQIAPKKLIYVSCDPATLARDLRFLTGHNYHLESVQPFDQFGMTVHVESVTALERAD